MHIAIIGAGIAGLSSYLFLHKHLTGNDTFNHDIKIYESHDVTATANSSKDPEVSANFMPKAIGAALGIGKNGLAVLQRIDDNGEVRRRIQSKGHTISRWKMKSARGWTIVDTPVTSGQKAASNDKQPAADMVLIARYSIWEVLRDEVLKLDPKALVNKKLSKLDSLDDGQIRLHFADGSATTADLVIGADGLRSLVRRTIFEHSNDTKPQTCFDSTPGHPSKSRDYITPQFEHLIGLGGFVPSEVLRRSGSEKHYMTMILGANGFFGHGYIGQAPQLEGQEGDMGTAEGAAVWWSTFSCSDPNMFRTADAQEHTQPSNEYKTNFDKQAALSYLLDRHQAWHDPTIKDILGHVAKTRALEHTYPTYTSPELPTWQKDGNMVLIGDAAHALQPSSGQGASQALEDSESLALFLKFHLESARIRSITHPEPKSTQQRRATARALTDFVSFRKPRIAKIYKHSQQASRNKADMSIIQEFVMYFFIWLMSKLQFMQSYNEEIFEYNLPSEVAITIYENSTICTLQDFGE